MNPNLALLPYLRKGTMNQLFDPGMARAILQHWAKTKAEDGNVERTLTQVAQAWPVAEDMKFENLEAAINVFRQACDYLYQGMKRSVTEQKADQQSVQSLQASTERCRHDIDQVSKSLVETQTGLQARDQRIDDLAESIFANGVTIERGLQERREGLASVQVPERSTHHEGMYQEHAREMEQAIGDLRSKMSGHEKKFSKGEKQMH